MCKHLNDSTDSLKGIIYQIYLALDECFSLSDDEWIYIETYGDITISGNKQTEVKHKKGQISNISPDILKTISNWVDNKFDDKHYKKLVFITTQNISGKAIYHNWNNKNHQNRIEDFFDAHKKYLTKKDPSKSNVKYISTAFNNELKLKRILKKLYIIPNSCNIDDMAKSIFNKYTGHIPEANRESYFNALVGCIFTSVHRKKFALSKKDFNAQLRLIASEYDSNTVVFPSINISNEQISNELNGSKQQLFLKKIDDIQYHEVKHDAARDYLKYKKTVLEEINEKLPLKKHYDEYETAVLDKFKAQYRIKRRNTSPQNIIRNSQDFFDEQNSSTPDNFFNYNSTPQFFRNGIIHDLADDKNGNIKWKMEEGKDE